LIKNQAKISFGLGHSIRGKNKTWHKIYVRPYTEPYEDWTRQRCRV